MDTPQTEQERAEALNRQIADLRQEVADWNQALEALNDTLSRRRSRKASPLEWLIRQGLLAIERAVRRVVEQVVR